MQPTRGELIGRRSLRLAYWTWLPDEAPRATAALVHGIGEHTGRYVHVAEALAQRGYAVYGVDHRGHGASEGARAYVDRFDDLVEDLHLVVLEAKGAHAGLSAFMLGHSMGGLIALRYALQHQEELAGLVLSGVALRFAESVSPLVRRSARVIAALAPRLPISRGHARGESVLSRDPAVQARFDADPLCFHGRYCARTGFELLKAAADALARLEQLTLPLLVMHGAADKYTNPAGSRLVYERARSGDKTLKLWPGLRHEILNEPEQGEVIAFTLDWLDERRRRVVSGGRVMDTPHAQRTAAP